MSAFFTCRIVGEHLVSPPAAAAFWIYSLSVSGHGEERVLKYAGTLAHTAPKSRV